MNRSDDSPLLTVGQVAEFLQFVPGTVYRLLNSKDPEKQLPGRKIGGQWRIYRPELEEYVRRRHLSPPPPHGEDAGNQSES